MNNAEPHKSSAVPSTFKLVLREPLLTDTPALFKLMEDFQEKFLDDFQAISRSWARELVLSGELIIIDAQGVGVGAVWFSDRVASLHATLHLLLRPQYFKQAFRQQLFEELLDKAFYSLQVRKIKAKCLHTETTAIALLKRYKFKQNGLFRNETLVNNRVMDIFTFELHRKFWEKYRHEFWSKEKREASHKFPPSQ